jgi:hypothetical protein
MVSSENLFRASIDHLKSLFLKHGSDCWWTLPMDELLPREVIEQVGVIVSAALRDDNDF